MVKKKNATEEIVSLNPCDTVHFIGQDSAERTLLDAWQSGRMPHAWLVSGTKGIGKATLAYRFARFVLAQSQFSQYSQNLFDMQAKNMEMSASEAIFQRISAGSHGDFLVLETGKKDAKGKERKDISVDDARNVSKFLRLTGAESQRRVVLIDSVDDMNRNAANALLKILEEPPEHALILLVSHNPGRLLPTIRSRCRSLKLVPLELPAFTSVLLASIPDISKENIEKLYDITEGAPGMAITLYNGQGIDIYRSIIEIMHTLSQMDRVRLHQLGDRLAAKGTVESWPVFRFMLFYFFHALTTGKRGIELVEGEHKALQGLAKSNKLPVWLDLWETARRSIDDVERINLDKKHVLINLFTAIKDAAMHH